MDVVSEKLSIKTLIFTKAIPNYVIPVNVSGHKVYACTDCGDKFIFESSYNDHVNRKSVQITYMCRFCNQKLVFFNRCNLLSHIRSHVTKTAAINVSDLNIEPLPASFFLTTSTASSVVTPEVPRKFIISKINCFECKADIFDSGILYKDRATHLMKYTNEVYSCPICLFTLPTICALKTHIRLHLKCPPYYCPECGVHLAVKNVDYPYNHDCEGFKMMRATARVRCPIHECQPLHPNDYSEHMMEFHLKKVYKCPFCVVACFNVSTMEKHMKTHRTEGRSLLFYQCDLCPGRFVIGNHLESHLKTHSTAIVYPCWTCNKMFQNIPSLLFHFIEVESKTKLVNEALQDLLKVSKSTKSVTPKRKSVASVYRVVKRCEQCKRSFTYRCKYREINNLPNECPYKCSASLKANISPDNSQRRKINCHICQTKINENWVDIKKHYAKFHKTHKWLVPKINLKRIDAQKCLANKNSNRRRVTNTQIAKITKQNKKKCEQSDSIADNIQPGPSTSKEVEDEFKCNMCANKFNSKLLLEKHLVTHRDPCMAYQCLECGQSFVVKPTFAKHLILEHKITDSENYISEKECYNELALMKYQNSVDPSLPPVGENQCTICREEFLNPEDLEKHFRGHGMAFLMKNNSNKVNK